MIKINTAAVTGLFVLLAAQVAFADQVTVEAEKPVQPTYASYKVSMTAYNAVPGQTDSTPTRTSIGAYTNPEIIAARSSDLADELPYGTVIEIVPLATSTPFDPNCGRDTIHDMLGYRVIADAMNARMRNKIDILLDHKQKISVGGKMRNPARVFGMCKNVEIRVVGKIDTKVMPKSQEELAIAIDTQRKIAEIEKKIAAIAALAGVDLGELTAAGIDFAPLVAATSAPLASVTWAKLED